MNEFSKQLVRKVRQTRRAPAQRASSHGRPRRILDLGSSVPAPAPHAPARRRPSQGPTAAARRRLRRTASASLRPRRRVCRHRVERHRVCGPYLGGTSDARIAWAAMRRGPSPPVVALIQPERSRGKQRPRGERSLPVCRSVSASGTSSPAASCTSPRRVSSCRDLSPIGTRSAERQR